MGPRNDLERKLAAIWEELLQRERVGVTDGFFDLGGHSLLAVMAMTRIEQELGVRLPLSVLVESPTIASLAAALESSHKPRGHVLALNGGGARPALVVVSGVGGFGLIFRGLAKHLGDEQPVLALNAVGSEDEGEGTDHSIEEIAAIYEPEVLAACPNDPIVLGGYSFGILVAFELARRLRAKGRRVPLLCSFDGFAPGYPKLLPLPTRVAAHVRAIAGKSAADRSDYLRDRVRNVGRRILTAIGRAEEAFDAPAAADPETARRLRKVVAGLWKARGEYRPTASLDSELLLVKTSIQTRWHGNEDRDAFYGWRSFVRGDIHVATVAGEHLRMFDGTADREIAEVILRAMDRLGLSAPASTIRRVSSSEERAARRA